MSGTRSLAAALGAMHTDEETDLAHIIAAAKAGDPGAFSTIYARYAGNILRYFYARTREPDAAQDLTQEVFVRVLRGIGGLDYRGERSFVGWLYTIASNVLIGQSRRRQPVATPLDEGTEVIDPRGPAEVQALHDRMELQQAIDQLTADQQQVLTLKFFADLSNPEIARAIGRTEGAVKALQHRALTALQGILQRTRAESHAAINGHTVVAVEQDGESVRSTIE